MINQVFIERLDCHRLMVLADFLDARATREGFVNGQLAQIAVKLKLPSTWHLKQDLEALAAQDLIKGLAWGRDGFAAEMIEPQDRYKQQQAEDPGPSLLDDQDGSVFSEILRHWNEQARKNPQSPDRQ